MTSKSAVGNCLIPSHISVVSHALHNTSFNHVADLLHCRFKIEDAKYAKDELAAWACIRLDRLQPGYRFVNLFDAKGQKTAGLLFIKIEKKLR